MVTSLAFVLALMALNEWIGLAKPDSFSFAYDIEEGRIVGATYVDAIVSPMSPYV
jgi:hypothetical protein